MNIIIRSIGMICLLSALAEVFVIEWIKGMHTFSSVTLSIINIILALAFGVVGWKTFKEHIKEERLSEWVIVILMFLNLGFSQMIYANYSKLDDVVIAILNKCSMPSKDDKFNVQNIK
ncbi:hypothetical protein AGMMS49593_08410 [Endomicrobiia bacterium]|nr:hypothetical protein AGMMS49593_08410 [Endomicrobiia bacterium]